MKFAHFAVLGFGSLAVAQSIEPSPTESIGCEPHGDHWHCEGPRPTEPPVDDHDDHDDHGEDPGPSPTESVGCEPHGDHWHCEGPRPTTTEEHDDHDDHTEDPGPSPTDSVGCEPHGDHWHCEGPLPTDAPEPTESSTEPITTEHDHDDDHDHTENPGPSPTESVGCEPHGDHWHCEGPVTSDDVAVPTPSGNGTVPTSPPEAGAAALSAGFFAAVGGLVALFAV